MASAPIRESSDSDRKPCAIVPPNGVCAAAVGIGVDELPVLGCFGEGFDPRLIDRQPLTRRRFRCRPECGCRRGWRWAWRYLHSCE